MLKPGEVIELSPELQQSLRREGWESFGVMVDILLDDHPFVIIKVAHATMNCEQELVVPLAVQR